MRSLAMIVLFCLLCPVLGAGAAADIPDESDNPAMTVEFLRAGSPAHPEVPQFTQEGGKDTGFTPQYDEDVVSVYRYRTVNMLPEYFDSIRVFYKKNGVWNSKLLVSGFHINPSIGGDVGVYIQKTATDIEVYYYTATFGDFRTESYYRWKLSDPSSTESILKTQFLFEDSQGVYIWDSDAYKRSDPNWDVALTVNNNRINATDTRTSPYQTVTVLNGDLLYPQDPFLSHGSYPGPIHSFITVKARLTSLDGSGNWDGEYLIYESPRHADKMNRTWTNPLRVSIKGSSAGFYNKFTTKGMRITLLANQSLNLTFTNKWLGNNTPMVGYQGEMVRWDGTSWETSTVVDTGITNSMGQVEYTLTEPVPGEYYYQSHLPAIEDSWSSTFTLQVLPRPHPDIGVFRGTSWNNWIFDRSMDGVTDLRDHYGAPGDIPLIADFNNDNIADRALFRSGEWIIDYRMDSSVNNRTRYGLAGDIPLAGRINTDGNIDRAVFRAGSWIIDYGFDTTVNRRDNYGTSGDIPLIGDFNNDGFPDRAVFRGSTWNNWIFDYGMNGVTDARDHFGQAGDIPVVADFNRDGITDRAVFRNGTWIIDYNMNGSADAWVRYGQTGDGPLVWNL